MLTRTGKTHQASVVIPVQCLMFIIGIGLGWLPPALSYFLKSPQFKLNSAKSSWVGSLHHIGKLPGSFLAALLMNNIGRKNVFVLAVLTSLILWIIVLCGKHFVWICISRFIYGMTAGITETMMPLYISENCSPKMRGVFCASTVIFFSAGITVSYISSTFLSYNSQAIINIVLSIIILFTTFLLKETPQFLLMKNRVQEARERFIWLQGSTGQQTQDRFEEIQNNVKEEQRNLSWHAFLRTPENRKSLRILVLLNMLIMSTGFTGVNNYLHRSFSEFTNAATAHYLIILYGLVQFIFVIISSVILDRFNRRTCLLFAIAISFCTHVVCAELQYLNSINVHVLYFPWLILACNSLYASMFVAAMIPLFSIIRGELLPLKAKAIGSSISILCNATVSFIVAKEFLIVKELYGNYVNFLIYAVACLVLFIYAYFDLPETRGKSLVRIQEQLKS